MADLLDAQLYQMILENWGLVHELEARARVLGVETLAKARVLVEQSEALADERFAPVSLRTYGKNTWFIACTHDEFDGDYVSYTQASLVREQTNFTIDVYTTFVQVSGMSISAVKSRVLPKFSPQFGAAIRDDPSYRQTVIEQFTAAAPNRLEQIIEEVAAAAQRQLALAVELRTIVMDMLPDSARKKKG